MLKLVARKNSIESASVRLTGDELAITAMSSERQDARTFGATAWSWRITPNGSGDQSAYVSIEAKRADGKVISTIVPLQLEVKEDWAHSVSRFLASSWQWIAGSLVIPGLIFLWGRIVRKKQGPMEPPMLGPRQPRPQDRRPLKRQ
jgi:hypothetical protein